MMNLSKYFLLWLTVLLSSSPLYGGYIELKGDIPVVHVKCALLPDPARLDTATRADLAVVKSFIADYSRIVRERYAKKYLSDPAKYGSYNWNNVEIQLDRATGIQVQGVESDLLMIAGGMAPDVLYVNFRKSDTYIRNNFLYPLDDYFAQLSKQEKAERVHPKIWSVIRRRNDDGAEHIWAIPYGGMLGKVLLYRKDLFDEHKIKYPDADWTWDDLYKAARKLTDPAKGTYGIGFSTGRHESWNWLSFLWSAGADVMVYNDENNRWRCVFDTPEAAAALDFYVRLSAERWVDHSGRLRRGYAYKDNRDLYNKWDRGLIGIMQAYIDEQMFSKIDPDVTGMAPLPLGPTGIRGGELNSRMFGLFSGIESEVVRDAAWEFIRYYGCEKAFRIRTKIMVEGGLGRFVNPKYLRRFGYPEIIKLSPPDWSRLFDISIASGRPEPYGRNSNVAYDLMTIPIQEAEEMMLRDEFPADDDIRLKMMQRLLKTACARANEIMIGKIPPREMFWRRILAYVVLLAIAIGFFVVFRKVFKVFTPLKDDGRTGGSWQFGKYAWAYVLLIPAAATIFLWRYVPLARGSVMAFYDYKLIGDSIFAGVDNFANLLVNADWWRSVYNALRYSLMVLSFTFLPPIILAILLQEVPRGKLLFRTIYYLPAVITGLVTILLWKQFYDPSDAGVLNMLILKVPAVGFIALGLLFFIICAMFAYRLNIYSLHWQSIMFLGVGILIFLAVSSLAQPVLLPRGESFGESVYNVWERLLLCNPEPYRWLHDSDIAMVSCVIPMVWAGMGPGCLIYLAALKGIPDDYYEAADIDGATFIDKILFVVFPSLKALIIINFVGAFIASWYSSAGNILAMTGGGADTEVASLHIWYKAFTYLQFGPATSMAWLLGFILIGFTVHQLRILSRVEFKTTGRK